MNLHSNKRLHNAPLRQCLHALLLCLWLLPLVWVGAVHAQGWTASASLTTVRSDHTTTLLPSGKILVVGGKSGAATIGLPELYDPVTGAWTSAASLAIARYNHTATLLTNGKVLVVGGYGGLDSAELYDPIANTWVSAGGLTAPRAQHTATLLADGKVLVVGGTNGNSLDVTEVYDPVTNTWSVKSPLNQARFAHTATLLANGQVLVVGGTSKIGGSISNLGVAELYDPGSDVWLSQKTTVTARANHTATLLPNGNVLVAGGSDNTGAPLAIAELYDATAGSWTNAGNLTSARFSHTATLLPNGKVLFVGGNGVAYPAVSAVANAELYNPLAARASPWSSAGVLGAARYLHTATLLPSGTVLVWGGRSSAGGTWLNAEFYAEGAGIWFDAGSLVTGRLYHTTTLLTNGKVLVAGGGRANGVTLNSAELYDPAAVPASAWSNTGSLSTARRFHTTTPLANGKVLAVGGEGGSGYLTSTELYEPATNTWSNTRDLAAGRTSHTATLLSNGKVLVVGGFNGASMASAELYDPATNRWSGAGNLTTGRYYHTATLLPNGKVLVAGGASTGGVLQAAAELYNPETNTWSGAGNLTTPRVYHAATLLPNGKVLIAAGSGGTNSYLAGTELYDPGTNTWSGSGSLTTARGTFTATLLPSGKVLAVGGYGVSGTGVGSIASTELYDPATGTWSIAGNMVTGRYFQTATLLANGRLLVAGGNSYNSSIPNSSTYAVNAELYDPGLGYADSRRPVVAAAGGVLARKGAVLSLTGTQLTGDSEGSGGATNNSAGNLPIVQLRRLEGDIDIAVAPAAMSATAYTSQPLGLLPVGTYRLTVFSNGVPSVASLVNVGKSINLVPIISLLLD